MATESFTNSNGVELFTHSANWNIANALSSDFIIDTNALRTPFSRSVSLAAYYSGTFANDQYAEAQIVQVGSDNMFMGVCVRGSSGNAYIFYVDTNQWVLAKVVAGVYTELSNGALTLATNDLVRLEASGTGLTGKVNGSTLATATDSSLASGNPGVSGQGSAASGTYTLLDNWVGADLTTGHPAASRARGIPGMIARQRFGRGW